MPELPEVETVRDGLDRHLRGQVITAVEVFSPRTVRHQAGGAAELAARLTGRRIAAVVRRGKFTWAELFEEDAALLAHLGMSGQMLVRTEPGTHPHLRARLTLAGPGADVLEFVDQRTFGYLSVADLVPTPDGGPGGYAGAGQVAPPLLPAPVAHIARDLLDEMVAAGTPGRQGLVRRIRSTDRAIKTVLLDQQVVSGVGNIYADEALWRARLHYARPASGLTAARVGALLDAATEVLTEALAAGGTSFDALYVNVNGMSGYFDRSLNVYGREGEPCPRCGTPIRRLAFGNRSSYLCPRCQRRR